MENIKKDEHLYTNLLKQYLQSDDKNCLKSAEEMSKSFVARKIFPEEIVRIDKNAVEKLFGGISDEHKYSLIFLHESLVAYRRAYERLEEIRIEQVELKSEIQVAANMQKTLLSTEVPEIEGLDIGSISVPYHQMNGDYYHFLKREDGAFAVAIADVIGKGVPAAMSMSMIKYAMDSFYEEAMSAKTILRNLNRVVERNVASHMFITMFYGQYFPQTSVFRYASAGHEPGFLYRKREGTFTEIEAKGLVLGVLKNSKYHQYEITIEVGDMIVLLTDGVTECRTGGRFITRDEVIEVIAKYNCLPAQQHVEQVYKHFSSLEDFNLKDDFTLIIIKKIV